jgi:hypothetical protein
MTVFAFASARHSPGVTTSVLALAAAWPAARPVLVVEADPSGGDLVCHFRLLMEPSLLSLAAAGRSEVAAADVWDHAQELIGPSPVHALVAPVDPRQVVAALVTLTRSGLGEVLAGLDADVLVDVGRLDPDSPAMELFVAAGVGVLVGRPTLNSADHLQQRVALLRALGVAAPHLLVVGEGTWTAEEMARGIGGATLLGTLPEDAGGARAVTGQGRGRRGLQRSPLWRAARRIAGELASTTTAMEPAAMALDVDDPGSLVSAADTEVSMPALVSPPASVRNGAGRVGSWR